MYGIHVRSWPWILVILCFLPCDVNAAQKVLDCGGNFTAASGIIQSPGHPGNYTNNQDCVYVIRRPQRERITLTFEQLDMPGRGVECTEDFLEIRDGDSANYPILARVCNTSLPSPKKTFQNNLWIRFRSNGAMTGRGFRASYTSGIMKETFLFIASSSGNIFDMDVNSGSRTALPLPGLNIPIAVDYDPVEGRLYWTDMTIRQIKSIYLNGSGIRSFSFSANAKLVGMAVDPLSRLVFYTDESNAVIGMIGISGTPHKTVISTNLEKPRAIVLDTINGVMFWTDWGIPAKIERANYDGTDRRRLHRYNLIIPTALAVDLKNNRLYWADAGTDLVEWSNLDGTSRRELYRAKGHAHFFGMTYYDNKFYVTDWSILGPNITKNYIHILSTDGSMVKTDVSDPGILRGIHMYVEDGWQRGPNGCVYNNGGCSHICIPASGNSSKCLCPDAPTTCREGIMKDTFLFLVNYLGNIFVLDVENGSRTVLPIAGLENPYAVDYDPVEGRLYWTDLTINQISSAYLNGIGIRSLKVFNANALLTGMAVDPLSRLVFYTDMGNGVIGVMGLSGTPHKTVISTDLDRPRAIVLDTMNGVMFWTDIGTPEKIERANYDGTDRRTLHSYSLHSPIALAVDLKNNRLYWADKGTDLVEWSDLDGTRRTQLYKARGDAHFLGMTFYDNMLYVTDFPTSWSNTSKGYLHILSTDGSMGERVVSVPGTLSGIHMYVQDGWQRGPNGCGYNNGGCSHICIPASENSSKCLCPDTPTVCREVSGASTTTQPVTSSTSTSTSPPIEVTIQGPTLFDTDGSVTLTLTCDPENLKRVRSVTWSVTCTMKVDRKCLWTPRTPRDDGKVVTCSITYMDGQSGVGSFRVQLNYPPSEPPMIHGYNTGDVLKAGDSLTMACLVRDGKPLVTSVIFSCPGHPDSVKDIRGDTEVQSLVVINPLRASDNGTRCVCTAEWKISEWYALSATRVLSVEGASITTRSVTSTTSTASTTSTSTPSPTQVTIEGPSLFDTDGSETMTLTCDLENRKRVRSVTWSVTCTIQDDRKCMWTPRPPEDDGKVVTCSITYIDGQSGVGSFSVQLNYPPSAPPMIHGYNTGDVVQAGDTLMMMCLVRDGKPLVTSVIFSCPGHPDNVKDIRGDTEVQSLVVINPLRASDNGVRCVCTAEWKRSEWYALSATRVLSVEGTISLPAEADQKSTKYIVSGAVGGGAFLLVVVVIIVVVICRRGGNNYERHASDYPAPDVELYPFARVDELGFLGNPCPARPPAAGKDEDTNSTYAEIVEEHCKGEKPAKSDYDSVRPPLPSARPPQENYDRLNGEKPVSKPTHPSKPADDYLHPAKSDSDYLHPATPADDYMHPVKPRAETDTDYMHSANPADDYLHPIKPRAPDSDDLHLATPADDYLHPVKPRAEPHSDYLHSANPADDYLHPIKPRAKADSD